MCRSMDVDYSLCTLLVCQVLAAQHPSTFFGIQLCVKKPVAEPLCHESTYSNALRTDNPHQQQLFNHCY